MFVYSVIIKENMRRWFHSSKRYLGHPWLIITVDPGLYVKVDLTYNCM